MINTKIVFSSVNRKEFIPNVKIIRPAIATFRLFIIGGYKLKSTEGTTQADSAAWIIYAIATIPLVLIIIEIIHDQPITLQN